MEELLALVSGLSLLIHLAINIVKRGQDSIGVSVWKFFSFYTILTNLLVCIWASVLVLDPAHTVSVLANNDNIAAAITFYIVTVGVGNYLIFGLPKLPPGELFVDSLVHAIVPILTLVYWVLEVPKQDLSFQWIPYWLIYPLSYALYTAVHGNWSKFYPYPFCDVQTLGGAKVALNTVGLSISVLLGGYLFVWLASVFS